MTVSTQVPPTVVEQLEKEPEAETESQGDGEDPEVLGMADGAGDRRGGVDPGGHGGARATEERGGAERMKEPDRARGMKGEEEPSRFQG